MKVYLAGKITGDPNYREKFAAAAKKLEERAGVTVISPAVTPEGLKKVDYAGPAHDRHSRRAGGRGRERRERADLRKNVGLTPQARRFGAEPRTGGDGCGMAA